MAKSNPTAVHDNLTTLVPMLTSIAYLPLITQHVLKTLESLAVCLADVLRPLTNRITYTLEQSLTIPLTPVS